jgi:hypothetical protein
MLKSVVEFVDFSASARPAAGGSGGAAPLPAGSDILLMEAEGSTTTDTTPVPFCDALLKRLVIRGEADSSLRMNE